MTTEAQLLARLRGGEHRSGPAGATLEQPYREPDLTGDTNSVVNLRWQNPDFTVTVSRIQQSGGQVKGWLEAEFAGAHFGPVTINMTATNSIGGVRKALAEQIKAIRWGEVLPMVCRAIMKKLESLDDVVDLSDFEPEMTRSIVYPTIVANGITTLTADSESGKSWMACAHAVSAATGQSVIPGIVPDEPARTLVLDWESSKDDWALRLKAVCDGADIDRSSLRGYIHYLPCSSPLTTVLPSIKRLVAERGIEIVIIDALGGATGGELIDASAVMSFFNGLRSLKTSTLVLHHQNRTGDTSKGYGSVFIAAAPRRRFSIEKSQQVGDRSLDIALSVAAANDLPRLDPMGWRMSFSTEPGFPGSVTWKRINVADTDELAHVASARDRIRSLLADGVPRKPNELSEILDIKIKTVRNTLSRLDMFTPSKHQKGSWVLAARQQP